MVVQLRSRALLVVGSCLSVALATSFSNVERKVTTVLNTDVCIIGGGAAGSYAAIGLLDKGVDLVVVEKQQDLGGHADTYFDPVTGQPLNLGVQIFHNADIVKNFSQRLSVSLVAPKFGGGGPKFTMDFTSGQTVADPMSNPALSAAVKSYLKILSTNFPYLDDGFFLPDPVPEDLVLPFGDFAKKYSVEPVVYMLNLFTQGWDISKVPALYALRMGSKELMQDALTGDFLTLNDTNQLYRSASAILGERVVYNASIESVKRNSSAVEVTVRTGPDSIKIIKAKKLLMTGVPVVNNLKGWDLTSEEKKLFCKLRGHGYYVGVMSNPDVPANTSYTNVGANNLTFNIPQLPAVYSIGSSSTFSTNKHVVYYGTETALKSNDAKAQCLSNLDAFVAKLGGTAKTVMVDWRTHAPFNINVSPENIRNGFYAKLYALQGKTNTWWSGSTFQVQDSTPIWKYTQTVIDSMTA
jgi:hypothetical protein